MPGESYLLWNRFQSICPAAQKGKPAHSARSFEFQLPFVPPILPAQKKKNKFLLNPIGQLKWCIHTGDGYTAGATRRERTDNHKDFGCLPAIE